jgi:hypothetical protein
LLDIPGVLGNPVAPGVATGSGRPAKPGTPGRAKPAPGSVRHSLTLLAGLAATGVVLLAVTDGFAAAATGVAAFVAAGLGLLRYVAGSGARDGERRRRLRLLDDSEPVLGGWEWLVHNALGPDGRSYFGPRLRPELQRMFAARLTAYHGVDLYRAPQRARVLIGADLWPWLDPAHPPPDPTVPGPVLHALLTKLDTLRPPDPAPNPRPTR